MKRQYGDKEQAVRHGKHSKTECEQCGKKLRADHLQRHLKTHNPLKPCRFCKKLFRSDMLLKHEVLCQAKKDERLCNRSGVEHLQTEESCTSVKGYFKSFELKVEESLDYDEIIAKSCAAAKPILLELLNVHPIKAQLIVSLSFYRQPLGEKEVQEKLFRSICEPLIMGDDIDDFFSRIRVYIKARIEEYERFGSGWIFDQFHCSHLEVAKYTPLSGSGTVKIPRIVKKMRSVLDISSPDNKCFLYCLLAKMREIKPKTKRGALRPLDGNVKNRSANKADKNPRRHTTYLDDIDRLDMGDVEFPVKIADISKIESLNNLSISVFEWNVEEKCAIPLKHGCGKGVQIDLLYIQDGETAHYMLIRNFNAFMRYRTKHHNSMFYCKKCLMGFVSRANQEQHSSRCKQGINQQVKMPDAGNIEFKAFQKQEKKMFSIYFDFESLTVPYQRCDNKGSPDKASTENYQKHVPCSFCIVTKSEFSGYQEETIVYSNEDPKLVVQTFISELSRVHDDMMLCYAANQYPIDMTDEDEQTFKNATICHICQKDLQWDSETNYPVRDHDHIKQCNNFRGAACNSCNINYFERTKKVPVFAHNLAGYDMNLFLLDLIKMTESVSVVPESIEKFKALYTEKFIFIDSFAFLSTSLDKLADNLKSSGLESFKRLIKEFPEHYAQLTKKGVYFYDYASSWSVFSEKELPPKDAFYSKLKEESISDSDYKHAQHVYKSMECQSLLDYMELYVQTDAIQLCDIFENFRSLCMEYYGLDPCHYISLPAFCWDAMLKKTGVKLDYITDIDQYTFLEENLRGGVTTINHRKFTANNKYLEDYDSSQPDSFIHYVDSNNLYGKGMSFKLPTGNFRWIKNIDLQQHDVMKLDPDGDTCYILEVDLKYPDELHDKHNDYPLAVESKVIAEENLSPYNRLFLKKHNEKFKPSKKLCPDLCDKTKYVCSLRNLQLFLRQGLVLEKIHRILAADQSDFLREYIEFNSSKRKEAKSEFESSFFKLCNNAIYGKTIEDLRKRSKVDIVKNAKAAKRLISKPQFKGFQILDEDITIVQSMKSTITLNKPIGCGFMVLENAKYVMGEFWYTVLKPKYGEKIKLLLSDTDSFIYAVYTEDGYADLYQLRQSMDLSGYSKTSVLASFRDASNRKVPGMFSDEKPNEIIREVIALKPKMYSIKTRVLECTKRRDNIAHICNSDCEMGHSATAKGIKNAAKKRITHTDYAAVLDTCGTTMATARSIRVKKHQIYSIVFSKRGLSAFDDKKYIEDNGINMLSYGHYMLRK